MALQFAILTALTERDSNGLELARRFDRSFGYFWAATHQQIYRELDRLQTRGFVAELAESKRPERGQPKRFAITPTGTAALREWMTVVSEPSQPRHAVIVQMRAAAALDDPEGIRAVVAHHLEVHERNYEKYREIEARDFAREDDDSDVLRHLVLKGGIQAERAWAEWCREVIDTLDERQRPRSKRKR